MAWHGLPIEEKQAEALTENVKKLIHAALDGDEDTVAEAFSEMLNMKTGAEVYFSVMCLAWTASQAIHMMYSSTPGQLGLMNTTGQETTPGHQTAYQFLTAIANDDMGTAEALFEVVAHQPEQDRIEAVLEIIGASMRFIREGLAKEVIRREDLAYMLGWDDDEGEG